MYDEDLPADAVDMRRSVGLEPSADDDDDDNDGDTAVLGAGKSGTQPCSECRAVRWSIASVMATVVHFFFVVSSVSSRSRGCGVLFTVCLSQ